MHISTDNVHLLAVLALDVRPSSVNVNVEGHMVFHIEVLRHETIGRHFDGYVARFQETMDRAFRGTDMGEVDISLEVVNELSKVFERQEAAPTTLVVGG
jgi:hypothetical protein